LRTEGGEGEMTQTQQKKSEALRKLHARPGPVISGCPWDVGTARIMTALGLEALGTASSGLAQSTGRKDAEGMIPRDEMLKWAGAIAAATPLPVTADLENGWGDSPKDCAATIRATAEAGLAAGTIEDAKDDGSHTLYDIAHATERIAAAQEAARKTGFVLVARADAFLHGIKDLDDVIRRAQSYEAAGADVIFAPGLPDLKSIKELCAAVSKPVTALVGRGGTVTLKDLTEAGVKEISLGSTLYRTALGTLFNAIEEIQSKGTFTFEKNSVPYEKLNGYMQGRK